MAAFSSSRFLFVNKTTGFEDIIMAFMLRLQRCSKISHFRNYSSISFLKSPVIFDEPQLLKSSFPVSIQVRNFWEYFPYLRPFYYEKDGMSREKYELIHRCRLFNYVFYGHLIGSATLACEFLSGAYYALKSYVAQEVITTITKVGPFVINYDLSSLIILSIFTLQCCLIIATAQRCILRSYYCRETDEFALVSLGWNPFKSKLRYCKSGNLVPSKDSMMNIVFGNHKLKGKGLYIRVDDFKSPEYYNNLVGDNYE